MGSEVEVLLGTEIRRRVLYLKLRYMMSETISLIKLRPRIVADQKYRNIRNSNIPYHIYTYHSLLQLGKYEFYVDLSV